ncbi:MAG: hypothetical protein P4L99_25875 [Chthoniobacter sp.]|nr:hypothetical protein [Chthoniobacter sp.]
MNAVDWPALRERLCALQEHISARVRAARSCPDMDFAQIAGVTVADTIYQVDRISEAAICEWFDDQWPSAWPVQVVMEGLEEGEALTFPRGTPLSATVLKCLLDPIDGTRNLMYDKRSAWSLAALAPQRGEATRLSDLVVAAMTELPVTKQTLADQISGVRGCGPDGIVAQRIDLGTNHREPVTLRPSSAGDFRHGFASFARFFPEGKALTARIEEELWETLYGLGLSASPLVFDDQYISTGGQIYELLAGHDRMIGDLRPLVLARLGYSTALVCHPYDICTAFLLREAGGVVESPGGGPVEAPLDTTSPVAWIGLANETLAAQIRPVLHRLLAKYLA